MNVFYKSYCRIYQKTLKIAQRFLVFRLPEVHDSLFDIPSIIKEQNLNHPLIVSGRHVSKKDEVSSLLNTLKQKGISFSLYIDIPSDPDIESIERLFSFYKEQNADSIIAIGGGSVLDASKALACKASKDKPLLSYKGILKVHHKVPFFIAAPTTAGTGSEATVASVITCNKPKYKFAINDPHLIPNIAVLDDSLLKGLPKETISITSMDALCHALEAFLSKSSTKLTDDYALRALSLIKENALPFYNDENDDKARKNMLRASFYAGVSFTRAYVGYVHALAHALGAKYHLAHGYCIAILLPYVLEAYSDSISIKANYLCDYLKLKPKSNSKIAKKDALIDWIISLNKDMGIPSSFHLLIKEEDIPSLCKTASKEANPLYPVPKLLNEKELQKILIKANQ